MPLHKRSTSHFRPSDRQQGEDHFLAGRVHLEIDGSRARARVEGTEEPSFVVGIDWSEVADRRVLRTFCVCRQFTEGRPCDHVWATLLALEESGSEHQPPGKDRLSVRKDRAGNWLDLGIEVVEEDRRAGPNGKESDLSRPPRRGRRQRSGRSRIPPPPITWRTQVATLRAEAARLSESYSETETPVESGVVTHFLINTAESQGAGGAVLDIFARRSGPAGKLGKLKPASLDPERLEELLLPATSSDGSSATLPVLTALPNDRPSRDGRSRRGKSKLPPVRVQRLRLPQVLFEPLLPSLCASGVLGWWDGRVRSKRQLLTWDAGPPWHLALRLESSSPRSARLQGGFERGGESIPLSDAKLVLTTQAQKGDLPGPAFVLFAETLARLELERLGDVPWITLLRETGEIAIPKDELAEALGTILELPDLPRLEAPEELQLSEVRTSPQPRLVLEPDATSLLPNPPLLAQVSFVYDNLEVSAGDPRPSIIDWDERTFLQRDGDKESAALVRLVEVGLRPEASGHGEGLELNPQEVPAAAEPLLQEGWVLEVRGTSLRAPSPPALRVESGIDWFELSGNMDFAGDPVELKEILAAISRGDRTVQLGDGSQGLLPAALVEAYGSLSELAHSSSEGGLRFLASQALLVDGLLAAMPPTLVDSAFAELREKLRSFERIKPKKEPRGFKGALREYQRHGLGWLEFLRQYGLGGVLADDMGLGKTVQVLALMRANRTPSKTTGLPSLVVAPRSLVYNWIDEAARFTPTLKTVEYGGPGREALHDKLDRYDLVVTTYGTMRRDVGFLAKVEFDTVILDEAQAIKNRDSQAAKASRLLTARHRLALTGTPIENHLGELGSLFEFLNPGLLGRLPQLEVLNGSRNPSKEELTLLADGIRPFILRRTKDQVLDDLPPKTEQVLFCTLRPEQREVYDKLRAGYQVSLLEQIETKGVSGSAIQVLEALLRLRQVACHPGLVNEEWEAAGSAKLEALFDQVTEVLEEGHKILIFSQFTKLLAYVRRHLDERGVEYAYLDGKTRKRAEVVERFQTDPSCNLFLISLKAGGLGLNLTAAGYVFLLDPWWNPAVEAQAIDRAHRIGQTQPVFSYRMIARDTVEEKILDLQRSKRQLADAVLSGDGQTLRDLTSEDLRILLS